MPADPPMTVGSLTQAVQLAGVLLKAPGAVVITEVILRLEEKLEERQAVEK